MGRNCHKCLCPLMLLKGEKRRTCARCGGGRNKQESNREYRTKHRERLVVADRVRYDKNREKHLAKAKEYYAANREAVLEKKKARDEKKWARITGIFRGTEA